jgi:LysM repeat protein
VVGGNRNAARLAAPAAFLAAATVAVLLVRDAVTSDAPVSPAATVAEQTQPAATTAKPKPQPKPKPAPTPTTTAQPTTTAAAEEFYVIESGDTLETIARQYGTTVEQLLVLNPDVDPVALSIGQRIRIR